MPRETASKAIAAGIATLLATNNFSADTLSPRLELIGGGGAERVRGTEHDATTVGDEHASQLAGGGCLAGPVDADDEQNSRVIIVRQCADGAVQFGTQFGDQHLAQKGAGGSLGPDAAGRHLLTKLRDDFFPWSRSRGPR